MIVVIQCAATKCSEAGTLASADGRRVLFVADPRDPKLERDPNTEYARPDDESGYGKTWRQLLLEFNNQRGGKQRVHDTLLPAYQLYEDNIYRRLVDRFGVNRVYILSAGWGLIEANFLTPEYNITFQAGNPGYTRRNGDVCGDFSRLPEDFNGRIVFLGGKAYVPLFCKLTSRTAAKRIVFYNSSQPPHAPGCTLQRFETNRRTNWHYACADSILSGKTRCDC
jgi:hypothetical protein